MAAKCAAASSGTPLAVARQDMEPRLTQAVSVQGTLFIHNIKHDKKPNKQNKTY